MRTFQTYNGGPHMCSKTIQKNRKQSAETQSNRCFYCNFPIWHQTNKQQFIQRYNLTPKQAKWLQCTAEHLTARCDGGDNRQENIVAACRYCNQKRHQYTAPPAPDAYRSLVTKRVSKNKWFPNSLAERLTLPHNKNVSN